MTVIAVNAAAIVLMITIASVAATQYHAYQSRKLQKRQAGVVCKANAAFRRFDGQCNNLENQDWGSINQPFTRLVANDYDDGREKPRTLSVNNRSPLQSARDISVNVLPPEDSTDDVTLMVMQWGQFLDHDVGLTAEIENSEGHHLQCECDTQNDDCFPIQVKRRDEHFRGRSCLEFTRSRGDLIDDGQGRLVRQQINTLTSFIDASHIYGVTREQSDALRDDTRNGKRKLHTLKTFGPREQPLLPRGDDGVCIRNGTRPTDFCFLAGDPRVNEMPGLAGLHTIFVREHNRIARFFKRTTRWSNERIFQETRRIVGAMMQHITYNEYLPAVLSADTMNRSQINVDDCFKYNSKLNPDLFNAFPTAVFRFGHSQIPEVVHHGGVTVAVRDLFSRPQALFERFNDVIGALSRDNSSRSDGHFAHSISRHLVLGPGMPETDLVARNIQRGRDHGLPSLNEYRSYCHGLHPIVDFEDLDPDMPKTVLKYLKVLYRSVNDLDLFVGGMLEKRMEGSLLGPTFNCLMGEQFKRLRHGDRYFYQHMIGRTKGTPRFGFTRAQERQITRVTLAKVICENSENKRIQENIFLPAHSEDNPLLNCDQIPAMHLNAFRRG